MWRRPCASHTAPPSMAVHNILPLAGKTLIFDVKVLEIR